MLYWWSPVEPLDVCWVFCPSVRGLQSILDVCQAYTKSHEIIFNSSNTVCMTFKAKTAKRTVIPLSDIGCTNSKICLPLQIFGDCLTYWVFRWQRHSETTAISILCNNANFSFRCRTQLKMYFFVPSVGPCVYHNYGVISGRHTFTDCVWPITLVAGFHTTCRSEQVLVGRLQVPWNIPTFEALLEKKRAPVSWTIQKVQECMVARFDAVRLLIFVLLVWTLQPHLTVLFWGRVQATTHSYVTSVQPGLASTS